jgi:L-amino acid N-acyltransferase YncA
MREDTQRIRDWSSGSERNHECRAVAVVQNGHVNCYASVPPNRNEGGARDTHEVAEKERAKDIRNRRQGGRGRMFPAKNIASFWENTKFPRF